MSCSKLRFKKFIFLFFFIFYFCFPAVAKTFYPQSNIAIFTIKKNTFKLDFLLNQTKDSLEETLYKFGRFLPVDQSKLKKAFISVLEQESTSLEEVYYKTAQRLKVDLYVLLSAYSEKETIFSQMKIIPLAKEYESLKQVFLVKSKIFANLPLKLNKKLIDLHKDLPLKAEIIKQEGEDSFLLNAGQWQGLKPGIYSTVGKEEIEVLESQRYCSLIKIDGKKGQKKKNSFLIKIYPLVEEELKDLDKKIKINTLRKYELEQTRLKGSDAEKKFLESTCIINPGSNACLPGYGSFLSTGYLGLQQEKTEIPKVVLSTTLIMSHFLFIPIKTNFKTNFIPLIHVNDKTKREHRLHCFLWASLPLTITASYFDQLAFQFKNEKILPPFFKNQDAAAFSFSLFIPGGGLFYKGYNYLGWGYYSFEMALASYGVYHFNDKEKSFPAFISLGAIKLLELANAYFINSSYDFYNLETSQNYLFFDLRESESKIDGLNIFLAKSF